MSVVSNIFFVFVLICLIVYYLVPGKYRWAVLLIASYGFFAYVGPKALAFLLYSTAVTYFGGLVLSRNILSKNRKKGLLILFMVLDLGMLVFLKYANFLGEGIWSLFGSEFTPLKLMVPLGISYYTLQSLGYMLDVYWKWEEPQKNFFKYALFVAFFPQVLMGPIGRYGYLKTQLLEEHELNFHNIKLGIERIIWGLFKKMVIADWAALYRQEIFSDLDKNAGLMIIGVILYSIELYGDFSGGIDIMLGVSSMFGIKLDENFRQPYFSGSLAEFWRRWHITLGRWMKEYVVYPMAFSTWQKKIQKKLKKAWGRKQAAAFTSAVTTLVVFLLVGMWHEATWITICWGLYNGVVIAFSVFCAPVYEKIKTVLHINDKARGYIVFTIIRTYIVILIGWTFSCVYTLKDLGRLFVNVFTHFDLMGILDISSGKLGTAYTPYALLTVLVGCMMIFAVSFITEKGKDVREMIGRTPFFLQVAIFMILLLSIPLFGPMGISRGFIYAQF